MIYTNMIIRLHQNYSFYISSRLTITIEPIQSEFNMLRVLLHLIIVAVLVLLNFLNFLSLSVLLSFSASETLSCIVLSTSNDSHSSERWINLVFTVCVDCCVDNEMTTDK